MCSVDNGESLNERCCAKNEHLLCYFKTGRRESDADFQLRESASLLVDFIDVVEYEDCFGNCQRGVDEHVPDAKSEMNFSRYSSP